MYKHIVMQVSVVYDEFPELYKLMESIKSGRSRSKRLQQIAQCYLEGQQTGAVATASLTQSQGAPPMPASGQMPTVSMPISNFTFNSSVDIGDLSELDALIVK